MIYILYAYCIFHVIAFCSVTTLNSNGLTQDFLSCDLHNMFNIWRCKIIFTKTQRLIQQNIKAEYFWLYKYLLPWVKTLIALTLLYQLYVSISFVHLSSWCFFSSQNCSSSVKLDEHRVVTKQQFTSLTTDWGLGFCWAILTHAGSCFWASTVSRWQYA